VDQGRGDHHRLGERHDDAAQTRRPGQAQAGELAGHRFTFDSIMEAYDSFGRAAETKALKAAITR
jgi:hypothetical protein